MTDWCEWSERDWKNWIREKLNERKNVFGSSAKELLGSYNREKSHARSYEGRQLLELIQNADDAGADYPYPNKMLVKLTHNALYIANTGVSFSPDGIESLMISDTSPKQLQGSRCIGYKGLGFRSVLGWTSSIIILSGTLSIGFSKIKAENWLNDSAKENNSIMEEVVRVEKDGLPLPIATLSIPYFISREEINNDIDKILYDLHNEGYETVIRLAFDTPGKTYEKVQKQIEYIGSEILLFCQHLEELQIHTSEEDLCWKVKRDKNDIIVNPESQEPETWKLFSKSEEIPKEYRRPEQPFISRYEIKLATNQDNFDTGCLFTYFPTEVRFPFPLIAHVTFELTDNRQNLIDSDINRFIANKLAEFMVDLAEKSTDPEKPWSALLNITPSGDIDPVLIKLGFLDKLIKEIKSRKIIPVLGKHFECPGIAKRINCDFNNLITNDDFSDICLYTENQNIIKLIDDIEIQSIQYDDLIERMNRLSNTNLPIDVRAEIIYRLIEKKIIKQEDPPELLIDENGEIIAANAKALLPSEDKFSLPEWVPQKFVNSKLTTVLKEKFEVTRTRDLVFKLKVFNVQDYNMATILSSIVAETNKRINNNRENELFFRQQMLQVIWEQFYSKKTKDIPSFPETINIILPTREGNYKPSNLLYLGNEYPSGELVEYFYRDLNGPFVGNSIQLGLQGEVDKIESFLCWMGVADLPKLVKINMGYGEFLDNILEEIKYPAKFKNIIIDDKISAKINNPNLRNLIAVDRLEEVLKIADPHAIIAWLVKNYENINTWRTNGDINAKLTIRKPYQQYSRELNNQIIPSYPLWLLRNIKWLPVANGEKQSPSRCLFTKGISKEISTIVGYPSLNLDHPLLKKYKIDITTLKNTLATVGVVTELDDLSWDSFYEILLELPEKDLEGRIARSIYRSFIGRESDSNIPMGDKRNRFLEEGEMWGSFGENRGYFPVSELYYFDNHSLPESILSLFPSLDLDKRRGADKVKRIFSVKPFILSDAKIKMEKFEEHPFSDDFEKELENLMPYIYALRVDEDSSRAKLRILKKFKVILCRSAKCSIKISNEEKEIILKEGESITVNSIAYLVVEPIEYEKSLIKDEIIADTLGEIISNILRVELSSNIARLATCSLEKRHLLLEKITGSSEYSRLNKARELLESTIPTDEFYTIPPIIYPPKPEESIIKEKVEINVTLPTSVGSVDVSGGNSVQTIQSKKIKRRIKFNVKPTNSTRLTRRVVNPDRAENLAIEFEKAQKRFPILVSYFQGSEAYGCDILSFIDEKNMERFKESGDTNLIERLIEVKGSINKIGVITLKGNELKSASVHGKNYYLYRIYEGDEIGIFELIETPNPLGIETTALKRFYEIHPFKTKSSKQWDVIEVDEDTKL